jgi:hypothetical protein
MEVYITAKLPLHQQPAWPPAHKKRNLILDKIKKVLKRGYVVILKTVNQIKSLIGYFDLPKDDGVRLVYNRTNCRLKKVLYAPNFWLPTPTTAGPLLG